MLYAVLPGTVTLYDGTQQTLTYSELIALYNVDPADCILGPVTGFNQLKYINLYPRRDGIYEDLNFAVELGDEIKIGPNFDGSKRYTQETDWENFGAEREAEQLP